VTPDRSAKLSYRVAGRLARLLVVATALVVALGCGAESGPKPAMPVRVTVEPHVPGSLALGVHLKLENVGDLPLTVLVSVESQTLRSWSGRKDLSIHPIFRGEGPAEVTLEPGSLADFWFSADQVAPLDPILVSHPRYATLLVKVPEDARSGVIEAIAIGPVE